MHHRRHIFLLLVIAGMGGFLYGYDLGIIGAALLYLNKTISLTTSQESLVVAAVLAGGTLSSLIAGALADISGRKKLMIGSAVLFVASAGLIVTAHGFAALVSGRTLQGLSSGMIAVVVPLYLAESLPVSIRGRGTAAFQLLLTLGILTSLGVGAFYTRQAEAAGAGATAEDLLRVHDRAWREMFLTAVYPGFVFLLGSLCAAESPRWLFRHGRRELTLTVLQRSRPDSAAQLELEEMSVAQAAELADARAAGRRSLWRRKYVVPFALACAVLGFTQLTGINSILQFMVVMLRSAGLDATTAAERSAVVTALNVVFTVAGLLLVDRIGRKALMKIGTAGAAVALFAAAGVLIGTAPTPRTGDLMSGCLMGFIAFYALGPGVCVWLALSELMPTRIRSIGMGVGLLVNQGISTAIAALYLPAAQRFGLAPIFAAWGTCTVGFFLVVAIFLPETMGRTLEEIEAGFDRPSAAT